MKNKFFNKRSHPFSLPSGIIKAITFVFILWSTLYVNGQEAIKIGLVCPNGIENLSPEKQAALDFLKARWQYSPGLVDATTISSQPGIMDDYPLVWWHSDTTSNLNNEDFGNLKKNILDYVRKGGNLLLTLDALHLVYSFGIETVKPETRIKQAKDEGYGRKLGMHAFRSHPVFEGLNGGSYILAPAADTSVYQSGYFGSVVPANGKVVAVDWDYIFIREDSKLILEYQYGKGYILTVGAYTNLTMKNLNRAHLEKFLENALDYLKNGQAQAEKYYWSYAPQKVNVLNDTTINSSLKYHSETWVQETDSITLIRKKANSGFWDLAGKRLLVMGNENGGIDEIWAHPFMAVKDFNTRIQLAGNDSIINLGDLVPEIQVRPESFTRLYHFGDHILREITCVSPAEPVMTVHYEYSGPEPVLLYVSYRSNLRLMWPYSEFVVKNMELQYLNGLNAFSITDESGDFCITGGSSKLPFIHNAGQFSGFNVTSAIKNNDLKVESTIDGIPGAGFEVAVIFGYQLMPGENLDFVISASSQGIDATYKAFADGAKNPYGLFKQAREHCNEVRTQSTLLSTPDADFNIGYQWALIATDRFMVNTPGLGESMVAGYSTTKTGWDGGHKINGRPGYGWYFGRDAQWSGMAMLGYGDHENVRKILEMFIKYQDMNGKIYHELSTSGFVHYDAADATPLFIILAGRYLSHTGDAEFIRNNWKSISKALNYCFSTDTDKDHLIENTNVGHGWVEGGSLYGTHTTLYLASCWAEALKEASQMASATGQDEISETFYKESGIVSTIINNEFWNKGMNYFYDGRYKDGTYLAEPTIMPAIPMLFQQIEKEKCIPVLDEFASNQFTSDWGCRIIRENSPFFKPTGYHEGSVWPLFTGWASLAEYKNHNPVQGFSHMMNNLTVYHNWGLGFVEEVLNGEIYEPSGVCRHQCWSETMVLQPVIEGMLGFNPDALNNRISLAPAFPADWNHVSVKNLKAGIERIHFDFMQSEKKVVYKFSKSGSREPLVIKFRPQLNPGSELESVWISGKQLTAEHMKEQQFTFELTEDAVLEINLLRGISVIPQVPYPEPGESSKGERIIDQKFHDNTLELTLESLNPSVARFSVFTGDYKCVSVSDGSIMVTGKDKIEVRTSFECPEGKYCRKVVRLVFEKKF